MKRIEDFGDDRNKGWCAFCGGPDETGDHVPSRVLLDKPYPDQLPVVSACAACNNSFSRDEAYLACLIECTLAGSVETATTRPKVGRLLTKFPTLAERLRAARYERNGESGFSVETDRVRTVLLKLARGHVAYEQNEPQLDEPAVVSFSPFITLSDESRMKFEAGHPGKALWPEVGSRAMHRALLGYDLGEGGWIEVQPASYRYRVEYGGSVRVQTVIREYLAAEVVWE